MAKTEKECLERALELSERLEATPLIASVITRLDKELPEHCYFHSLGT